MNAELTPREGNSTIRRKGAMHRFCRRLILLSALASIAGCGDATAPTSLRETLISLGISEKPPGAAIQFDVLCDASDGSTCNATSLRETIGRILPAAAARPGSEVRIWALGENVAETTLVASQRSVASVRGGAKAAEAARQRFVTTASAYFDKAVEAVLAAPPKRRSPIAEGITRVAWSTAPRGCRRYLVIITDGWEVSRFADFECRRLPKTEAFLDALHKDKVLAAGTLNGASICFTFVDLTPIHRDGCPVTIERAAHVRELWQNALAAAGATETQFVSGAIDLTQHPGLEHGGAQ